MENTSNIFDKIRIAFTRTSEIASPEISDDCDYRYQNSRSDCSPSKGPRGIEQVETEDEAREAAHILDREFQLCKF